ncbi:MAG TPA: cytochrome c [Gaiellaceae bacterium]|nr:cytochrome c [Gaiellaceae bacterium]
MLLGITTTGKVVLILVAATFIVFALVVSMVVPRRFPDFPGRRLPLFIGFSVLLFGAQLGAVVWVTGTQETEAEAAAGEQPGTTEEPGTTTEQPGTTTEQPGGGAKGDPAAGKQVFASAGCGGCHTLADAGSNGSVGPNLDDAKPAYELVVDRVTHGKGVMPSFAGRLGTAEIQNVAAYVSSVAGTK